MGFGRVYPVCAPCAGTAMYRLYPRTGAYVTSWYTPGMTMSAGEVPRMAIYGASLIYTVIGYVHIVGISPLPVQPHIALYMHGVSGG